MPMPDLIKAYSVALVSLLAGAAFVHNIYKPDLLEYSCCSADGRLLLSTCRDCQSKIQFRKQGSRGSSVVKGQQLLEATSAAVYQMLEDAIVRAAESYDGEDEEEDQEAVIQSNIFQQYLEVCDEAEVDGETDALFARGLLRVREYLSAGQDNTLCLICLGNIKPTEAIWHCGKSCYALFHLPCIQEWARNQLSTAAYKASRAEHDPSAAAVAHEWGCPKCRFSYAPTELPAGYSCFCGKQDEPEWDPWLAPHSCGELCGKPVPGKCEHSCLLLCHPGPCPPCPLLVDASCYCGKATVKQRCGNNEYSCRAVCGRQLVCGHRCPEICHPGDCPPCQEVGSFSCACGAEKASKPCCQSNWHCTKPCGKTLACGRHKCDQVCHAGPCGSCPEEGERHCPCGKSMFPDLKCDEKAPTCGSTCGKLLECGVHRCQERCHYGPCTKTCRELVSKTCRCGRTQKEVLCHTDVRCDSKCSNMRSCGRHQCKRRCCDGESCPPCEEVCNRKLRCGNHRCPAPCHSGPCRPCPLAQTISCACGKSSYALPCGAEASAAPPRCVHQCMVPPTCRHAAVMKPHRCHFGPCPPCRSGCGTALACGHACSSSSCHDTAPPAVAAFQQPKPPKSQTAAAAASSKKAAAADDVQPPAAVAAAEAAAMLAAGQTQQPCPACTAPVQTQCIGQHVQHAFPCHAAKPYSCGQACGRTLSCSNHTCSKACHCVPGAAAAAGSSQAAAAGFKLEACEVCTRACAKPRSCSHLCPKPCHPGPCEPCQVDCTVACHCGKTTLHFPCHEHQAVAAAAGGGGGSSEQQQGLAEKLCCGKPCHKQLPHCPHPCREVCHSGVCPNPEACSEEVTVRCACRRLKQKWPCAQVQQALAAAGGSRSYDGAAALKLLQCDAGCAAVQQSKAEQQQQNGSGSRSVSPSDNMPAGSAAAAAAAAPVVAAIAKPVGAKKLSRAEREALAAQKEAERLQQEAKEKLRQRIIAVVILLTVCGVLFGMFKAFQRLVIGIDSALSSRYALEQEL